MSEENVETFKRAIEAYNRRDIDAFLNLFDPSAGNSPLTPRARVRLPGPLAPAPSTQRALWRIRAESGG